MVEVFKTNVDNATDAEQLVAKLLQHFPQGDVHFDLNDCDKILRIEANIITTQLVEKVLNNQGYNCNILD